MILIIIKMEELEILLEKEQGELAYADFDYLKEISIKAAMQIYFNASREQRKKEDISGFCGPYYFEMRFSQDENDEKDYIVFGFGTLKDQNFIESELTDLVINGNFFRKKKENTLSRKPASYYIFKTPIENDIQENTINIFRILKNVLDYRGLDTVTEVRPSKELSKNIDEKEENNETPEDNGTPNYQSIIEEIAKDLPKLFPEKKGMDYDEKLEKQYGDYFFSIIRSKGKRLTIGGSKDFGYAFGVGPKEHFYEIKEATNEFAFFDKCRENNKTREFSKGYVHLVRKGGSFFADARDYIIEDLTKILKKNSLKKKN